MLRWFPRLKVATACFSCSPPDLKFLDPYFIFMYMHYNYCHQTTGHLQLNVYYIITLYSSQNVQHFPWNTKAHNTIPINSRIMNPAHFLAWCFSRTHFNTILLSAVLTLDTETYPNKTVNASLSSMFCTFWLPHPPSVHKYIIGESYILSHWIYQYTL